MLFLLINHLGEVVAILISLCVCCFCKVDLVMLLVVFFQKVRKFSDAMMMGMMKPLQCLFICWLLSGFELESFGLADTVSVFLSL